MDWRRLSMGLWGVALLAAATPLRAQTVVPVTDINPGSASSSPSYLTVFQGALYFRANDAPHGTNTELWRYRVLEDGGSEVSVAAEIRPGTDGSSPADLTVHEGMLYFSARDIDGKTKLWRFDGSTASLVPDPLGWKPGTPQALFSFNGVLYFRAFASHIGIELYKFDGTQMEALNLFPGSGSSYPQHLIAYNGDLYFNAGATEGEGSELYRLDFGWRATKVTSIYSGGASPESMTVHAGELYFTAYHPDTGREIWRYNGSRAEMLPELAPGSQSAYPSGLTSYRGALYFAADNGIDGSELWRLDGNGATMVADINQTPFVPGIDPVHHSWPGNLFVFRDVLYFTADDGIHGRELWMHDGAETRMVADINPGPYGSDLQEFVVYQDKLLFTANDGVTGGELGGFVVLELLESGPVAFRRGDVNDDVAVDVSDAVTILLHLFAGGVPVACEKSADLDDDGALSVTDAILLLGALFTGGSAPPAPWAECGPDPTPDSLTCLESAVCVGASE